MHACQIKEGQPESNKESLTLAAAEGGLSKLWLNRFQWKGV